MTKPSFRQEVSYISLPNLSFIKVKQSIGIELADTASLKDLSKRYFVFPTTINRVINTLGKELLNTFTHLLQNLCFDEFTSVKNQQGKYSFIYSQILKSVKILNKHLSRIKNTFRYPYSNGTLEGSIYKIKLIKRIAHGYREFQNYKYRILLNFKDKQISKFYSSTSFDVEPNLCTYL